MCPAAKVTAHCTVTRVIQDPHKLVPGPQSPTAHVTQPPQTPYNSHLLQAETTSAQGWAQDLPKAANVRAKAVARINNMKKGLQTTSAIQSPLPIFKQGWSTSGNFQLRQNLSHLKLHLYCQGIWCNGADLLHPHTWHQRWTIYSMCITGELILHKV